MEKVWSIEPRWKKLGRLAYRGGSENRREKNAFVTNENASMRYSFASRGVGGGCGSECNIVHPRATAKPITHGQRARTHARAVYTVPRQSVPWIRTSRTLNSHVCVHACMCSEQPPLGPCVHRFSRDPPRLSPGHAKTVVVTYFLKRCLRFLVERKRLSYSLGSE